MLKVNRATTGRRRGRPHRWALAAALLVPTAVACSPPSTATDPAAGPRQTGATGDSSVAPPIDACQLLTANDVTPVIGAHDGGRPGSGVGESVCVWENPDTYHSITVSIGGPGTAAEGQLPESRYGPTEPGPDGIRFASGDVAEFAVGDRASEVQVVAGERDRDTTVRLIGLVRSRA